MTRRRILKLGLFLGAAGILASGLASSQNPASGSTIRIQSPLPDERFVSGEPMAFRAAAGQGHDTKDLRWTSSQDGELGTGPAIRVRKLSPGRHIITVSGSGASQAVPIRVFRDLWDLYQAPLSPAERDRIAREFGFTWVDGKVEDEIWQTYDGVGFTQSSPDPAKVVVFAKLDVLRHQGFAEPLPFTNGKSIYDHVRTFVKKIYVSLGCQSNTGGHGSMSLNRNFTVWDLRESGTPGKPEACKNVPGKPRLALYISPLYLFVHEARHSEPGEPGHVECNGRGNMDPSLENGSGHAAAALYLMWVYKYGLYDPPAVKAAAKSQARSLLKSRFCAAPTHSNPLVQAIVDELLGP